MVPRPLQKLCGNSPVVSIVDYMDVKAMEIMLKKEGDVLAITIEEPSDPLTYITPTVGQLSN